MENIEIDDKKKYRGTIPKDENGSFGNMSVEAGSNYIFFKVFNSRTKKRRELDFFWSDKTDTGVVYYIEKVKGDNTSINVDSCKILPINKPTFEVTSVIRDELGVNVGHYNIVVADDVEAKRLAIAMLKIPRIQSFIAGVMSSFEVIGDKEKIEATEGFKKLQRFMYIYDTNDYTINRVLNCFEAQKIARSDCNLPTETEDGYGQFIKK